MVSSFCCQLRHLPTRTLQKRPMSPGESIFPELPARGFSWPCNIFQVSQGSVHPHPAGAHKGELWPIHFQLGSAGPISHFCWSSKLRLFGVQPTQLSLLWESSPCGSNHWQALEADKVNLYEVTSFVIKPFTEADLGWDPLGGSGARGGQGGGA